MIYLIATLEIKPGSLPKIMEAVMPCIDATRQEAGCISYDLVQSLTDENTLMFVERWTDKAALDAHFQEPHLIAWRDAGAPFFVSRKIEIIEPADVEVR
uniref:putative quinol monooxygenase n=1 Tax=Pararhizobium sp. IMCC3301 TaxID=3067904 RepID=UPI0027427787|nr:putative quinol monooxygenase [Pararhizobium sp. IMCC3301]